MCPNSFVIDYDFNPDHMDDDTYELFKLRDLEDIIEINDDESDEV